MFHMAQHKLNGEDAGVILKYIRVQFVNADGTIIYSQDYDDTE